MRQRLEHSPLTGTELFSKPLILQLQGDFGKLHPTEPLSVTIPLSDGLAAYYSLSKLLKHMMFPMINNIIDRVNMRMAYIARLLLIITEKRPSQPFEG
jgi:hypothetical protein